MINKRYTLKEARMTFTAALVGLAIIVLAACGDSTTSNASAQPTAAPTAAMDMTAMPISEATATTAGGGIVSGAAPTAVASDQTGGGTTTEIKGTLAEWSLTLSQQEAPAGKIRFIVTNQGMMAHNFSITDSSGELARTPTFASSEGAQTLEVTLAPGTYTIICSLPGHAARGQKATLVVK